MSQYQRAASLLVVGRPAEAREVALAGLSEVPDDPMLLTVLADAQSEIEPKSAIEPAERAAQLSPENPRVLLVLARSYWRAGKLKKALDSLDALRDLAPEQPEAHSWRASIIVDRSRKRGQSGLSKKERLEALESASKGVELAPNWVGGHLIHGEVCLAIDDISGTNRSAHAALRIDPDDAGAHNLLGMMYEKQGSVRLAADHYVKAGKARPSEDSVARLRGLRGPGAIGLGIAGYVGVRTILTAGLQLTIGQFVVMLTVVALLAAIVLIGLSRHQREQARISMSSEAKSILKTDDELHRSTRPWWHRFLIWSDR